MDCGSGLEVAVVGKTGRGVENLCLVFSKPVRELGIFLLTALLSSVLARCGGGGTKRVEAKVAGNLITRRSGS
jgi:hypothetical protein